MSTIAFFRRLTHLAIFAIFAIISGLGITGAKAAPVLDVHPDTLRFYANFCGNSQTYQDTAFKSFTVSNSGSGSMSWTGTAGEGWIMFDPTQGGDFDSVYVGIDWTLTPVIFAAPLPGDTLLFESQIVIDAPEAVNSPQSVVIQLGYICEVENYILAAQPSSFQLTLPADDTASLRLYISETHNANIEYYMTNSSNWLILPETFAVPVTPDSAQLMIFTAGLAPGIYIDTVFIGAAMEPANTLAIPVILTVEGSGSGNQIGVTPSYFNFQVPPDTYFDFSLAVYETHGRAIDFVAEYSAPWLQITGGPVFTTPTDLSLHINSSGLPAGFYADTVFILPDTNLEDFPPVAVPVYVQIQADTPVVRTSPENFFFSLYPGDTLVDVGLFVYEIHGLSMPFGVSLVGSSGWLRLPFDLHLGSTPDTFHFSIVTDSLPPGTYGDSLVIYYPLDDIYGFDDVIVPVILNIEGNPPPYHLATAPTSFNFTAKVGEILFDTLDIFDDYGHQIEFFYNHASTWLAVNPLGMPPYATPMSLPVIAGTNLLEPGFYIDTIFVWTVMNDSLPPQTRSVPAYLTVTDGYSYGDANGDSSVDVGDAVYLVNYIFREGLAPLSAEAADANCDGKVDIGDIVTIVAFIFRDGPAPSCH